MMNNSSFSGQEMQQKCNHENIINFSLERELIGSRRLGTRDHRYVVAGTTKCVGGLKNRHRLNHTSTPRDLLASSHFTQRLPRCLAEREFNLVDSRVNKIFCGQWLDERRCLLGTKCNKLVLLDTQTGMYAVQPSLKSHPASRNIPDHCGNFSTM